MFSAIMDSIQELLNEEVVNMFHRPWIDEYIVEDAPRD
jgi:hypothetical protein